MEGIVVRQIHVTSAHRMTPNAPGSHGIRKTGEPFCLGQPVLSNGIPSQGDGSLGLPSEGLGHGTSMAKRGRTLGQLRR